MAMFSISETLNGNLEEVKLAGRLDVKAAAEADEAFTEIVARGHDIVLDLADLEYIASAGLRAFKRLHGAMRNNGKSLTVTNVQNDVMEIFEMTGFAAMLTFV